MGENTFDALATLRLPEEKDAKQLQALLDAHRQLQPDDPAASSWETWRSIGSTGNMKRR